MSHLIIDGYNLLAQSDFKDREALLKELKKYQKAQGHKITIFFDGTHQGTGMGDKYMEEYVEVVFSPLTVTADDMIEEFLETKAKSNMVIVSSDRRIQKAAISKRLAHLEAKEFCFKLKYNSGARTSSRAMPWMEGRTTEEEDARPSKKGGNPRKKSKKDRQKQRTMKKL